ncbi:hypothetical protein EDD16DRAFT_1671076 [Pisolithus croceorrhizus]|nr:hypothetical protein EDD16DRAFT_1671076 [Pisolithus croceorrhizus]
MCRGGAGKRRISFEDDMQIDSPRRAMSPESSPPPSNIRKRKAPPEEATSSAANGPIPGSPSVPKGEYETGRVICEVCGEGVSFRDEATGGFTLKQWDAHRQQCANTTQTVPEPVIYTPESTAEALANPPPKRRRAKRTEEERINYLRGDPYIAQYEAYRVLCASCDKWIRLRPNSTYCSIPWDAHRKSCLSKKLQVEQMILPVVIGPLILSRRTPKNAYGLDERNTLLSKDLHVRKFDAERVLCNRCDRWVAVSPENHKQAVHTWLHHRSNCQKSAGPSVSAPSQPQASSSSSSNRSANPENIGVPPLTGERELSAFQPANIIKTPPNPEALSLTTKSSNIPPSSPGSSFKDLTPTNFPPVHESRRRNAEQRAATLRADPLIEEVEPNRVFCSLCKKWVQLRQDSSYCAYPWVQHRNKCEARHARRVQEAAKVAESRNGNDEPQDDDDTETDGSIEDELDSDRALEDVPESSTRSPSHVDKKRKLRAPTWIADSCAGPSGANGRTKTHPIRPARPKGNAESAHVTLEGIASSRLPRRVTLGFADLDSLPGRLNFVYSSIAFLFTTTYEPTDEMTISALLAYLNAAMPPDKHEDFDTAEVAKAVAALHDRGDIIFEGDMLRLPD